jgi:hypothetical protein
MRLSLVRSYGGLFVGSLLCVAGCSSEPMPAPDAAIDSGSGMDASVVDTGVASDTGVPSDTGVMDDRVAPPTDTGVAADSRADVSADGPVARCAPGVDSDGDGLTNEAECAAMTDPYNPD